VSALTAVRTDAVSAPRLAVDLGAVAANVRTFAGAVDGSIMAVVKADGFGHGAVPIARTALANGATSLGVATIDEATGLRLAGIEAPVLSWLNPAGADFAAAVRNEIELAVPSMEHLRSVAAGARRAGRPARVHLHVDTGMGRDGASREEWFRLARLARRLELRRELEVVAVMSHLPCADQPGHPSTAAGREAFLEAVAIARGAGLRPRTLHLAATAAALGAADTHFDLCRIGAGLYGIGAGLRPALRLTAPVTGVRDVAAGTAVGYGHAWVADRPTRLALVPLGYGDGVPRVAGPRAEVLIHGRRRRIAGAISMDQLVVDVGDLPVRIGDEVTLFGPGGGGPGGGGGGGGEPTIADWSAWSLTIPHEIMTGLGARIPRSYGGSA
jgi:alanine racemase